MCQCQNIITLMINRKFSPLRYDELSKERYVCKQIMSLSSRNKKISEEISINSSYFRQKSILPKIKIRLKPDFELSNIVIGGRELDESLKLGVRSEITKKIRTTSPKLFIRKLPARFKPIALNVISKNNESCKLKGKGDMKLIQNFDSDEIRNSIERTKKIMNLEDNQKKNKILKNKDDNWKWISPSVTPLKTVRFVDNS